MKSTFKGVLTVLVGAGLFLLPMEKNVVGADFPSKPIKIIVAFSPGAGIDMEARAIAPYVQKYLGMKVMIENIPGADGKIGLTKLWKAKPDGHTLLIHTITMSMIGELVLAPEYRIGDFSHIYSWSLTNHVLMVNNDRYANLDDFIKTAKQRTLSAGMAGRGSTSDLMGAILADSIGIKVNWVPFDGGAQALAALAGNHIDFAIASTTTAFPLFQAGKIKPLLIMANNKDSVFPDVPLARERGYNFTVIPSLRGVDGPPKMEAAVVKKIEQAFADAIKDPEYLSWAQKRMLSIVPMRHDEYTKSIQEKAKAIAQYTGFLKSER